MNNTAKRYHALGLMSGSSLDGLDLAYCQFNYENGQIKAWNLIHAHTFPFTEQWQSRLRNLPSQSALTFAKTHTYFGHYMAELVKQFKQKYQITEIDFIASHGHTIFHQPDRRLTIQIGDGAALAALTNCRVICDFRSQDIALNGEGAPLAPLADAYLFPGYTAYLNLGGIANLSIPQKNTFLAGDVVPCNQILNLLANQLGQIQDDQGNIARTGTVHPELLKTLTDQPFFHQPFPKSLGNEWIAKKIKPIYTQSSISTEDQLATATEHIAIEIYEALRLAQIQGPGQVLVTGGGAFNLYLIERLNYYLHKINLQIAPASPELISFKEAILMGLLGVLRLENQANSWASCTRASQNTINGAVYEPLPKT
jgi:anhydro-N-acetylmuramic acid kinase